MPWVESAVALTSNKSVVIDQQDGLQVVAFQPFVTLTDANAANQQARVQNADGKLVFYTQSALNAGAPTVIFNTLVASPGQPLPSAIEIHAQDGVHTVGYQPFLTLTDANAGFAKARVQNANGDVVIYTQGGMNRRRPEIVVESATGDVHVTGTIKVDNDILISGADCAERFDVEENEELPPGTVVVLGADGRLSASREAYDHRVAGVIAGAGDYQPAIVMDSGPSRQHGAPVALVGKTFCNVDASEAAIAVGDLLTASSTPGHAMKATDPLRAFGAVIGKALRPLSAGTGLIPILVTLQ